MIEATCNDEERSIVCLERTLEQLGEAHDAYSQTLDDRQVFSKLFQNKVVDPLNLISEVGTSCWARLTAEAGAKKSLDLPKV